LSSCGASPVGGGGGDFLQDLLGGQARIGGLEDRATRFWSPSSPLAGRMPGVTISGVLPMRRRKAAISSGEQTRPLMPQSIASAPSSVVWVRRSRAMPSSVRSV